MEMDDVVFLFGGLRVLLFVILLIALDLFAAAIPAKIAQSKGRDFASWYITSLLFFPIALIVSLMISPTDAAKAAEDLGDGQAKKCPQCAELVKKEALKCRFCGYDFLTAIDAGHKRCPGCGESLLKEAVRCRHCGHAFVSRPSERAEGAKTRSP